MRTERPFPFQCGHREGEPRHQDEVSHPPAVSFVMKGEEVRSLRLLDRPAHRFISRIENLARERSGLCLQLKRRSAARANIIDRGRICCRALDSRRIAIRAEQILLCPGFCGDARPLRQALVGLQTVDRQIEEHASIRSFSLSEINLRLRSDDKQNLRRGLGARLKLAPSLFHSRSGD